MWFWFCAPNEARSNILIHRLCLNPMVQSSRVTSWRRSIFWYSWCLGYRMHLCRDLQWNASFPRRFRLAYTVIDFGNYHCRWHVGRETLIGTLKKAASGLQVESPFWWTCCAYCKKCNPILGNSKWSVSQSASEGHWWKLSWLYP